MQFAEIVVNVPIRRTFSKRDRQPAPADDRNDQVASPLSSGVNFQTFHYSVPPELSGTVQPGHLVWAPFGSRQVQGVVIRMADSAPMPTKPIQRLARPEPVLLGAQIEVALWMAEYYVAALAEVVKLFLPPGLLVKEEDAPAARTKRELQIELLLPVDAALARLTSLARDTPQARVLTHFLRNQGKSLPKAALVERCRLRSSSAVDTLLANQVLVEEEGATPRIALGVDAAQGEALLLKQQGLHSHVAAIHALVAAAQPVWRSTLARDVKIERRALRQLEQMGVVQLAERVRFRDPLAGRTYERSFAPPLTSEQTEVWEPIRAAISRACSGDSKRSPASASRFLLHGVTGSGKTEIYLRAIAATLEEGRQAIVLVPEIALTPQTVARFASRFPGRVTVMHSNLSRGERYDVWRHIRDGQFDIVVGPRSALFAPLPRLGLIVIDEEHEASYKQDAEEWGSFTVFYDARTVACHLCQALGIPLIMGSATPSMERYYAAEQGEVTLMEMASRVLGHQSENSQTNDADTEASTTTVAAYVEMPPVEVVDMRQELRAGNRSMFSRSLQSELHATLDAGEQAILFLNRRGTSTFVLCRDCGHVEECPRCEAPLTYHERVDRLICHRCNRRYPIPERCPSCQSRRIKYFGSGTQRVEEAVQQIAPRARLLRWDADTTTRKGEHQNILDAFAQHHADILIGTQMIAKGLDLPKVTLVGVVAADIGLFLPDFRSNEKTFQLLTQVAGRAGRSRHGGRVVVQTYAPEHYAIQAAAQHDYAAFYARELTFRREQQYPPVRRLARLVYWNRSLDTVQSETTMMAAVIRQRIKEMGVAGESIGVLGPAPAFFARYRGQYRWQLLIRADDPAALLRAVRFPFGWRIDIDPVSVL